MGYMIEQVEQRLGTYRLIRPLDKGAFADVYPGEHLYAVPSPLREGHPEIPPALEQVVFNGLSKEARQRYVDVLSFATAFEEASYVATSPYMLPVLQLTAPSITSSYQVSQCVPVSNI